MLNPSKIICIGLNYKKHSVELGKQLPTEPIIFLKPLTTIIYNGDKIIYPKMAKQVDYEAELAIVIGKKGKDIKKEASVNYIKGYLCANDVTARDLQKKDGQWTRAKSFDTFCPISKNITPAQKIDPTNLNIKAILNGKVVQNANTADMIFDVYEIVSFVSQVMTLYPDDIILTGTPSGIGPLQKGDEITIEIEQIGKITNKVI